MQLKRKVVFCVICQEGVIVVHQGCDIEVDRSRVYQGQIKGVI